MTDIGPSGYMTDGAIMAWLEQKSADKYGELGDMMKASNDRSELIKRYSEVKADVDAGNYDDAVKKLEDIRQSYAGTPDAAAMDQFCLGEEIHLMGMCVDTTLPTSIQDRINQSTMSDSDKQQLQGSFNNTNAFMTEHAADLRQPIDYIQQWNDGQRGEASAGLQTQIDDLGRIDNLDLIKINQAVSDAKQTEQLASNILSSRDQTSNSIISNMRG